MILWDGTSWPAKRARLIFWSNAIWHSQYGFPLPHQHGSFFPILRNIIFPLFYLFLHFCIAQDFQQKMCLAHSRASRSRVRQSISSRDCTLENSCPCTGIAFANSFIFLYNILIYHNVGDSVCQISLLRKYAVNITAWIFRTENPPRCRGGFKESEEFT